MPRNRGRGWAAWITVNRGGSVLRVKRSAVFKSRAPSSHYAEVWALRNGIAIARKQGVSAILAQSDCTGAIGAVKLLEDGIIFRHVKGHTSKSDARSWVNRWCDREARKQMRRQRTTIQQQTYESRIHRHRNYRN